MAGVEKVCEFSDDYTGHLMYVYKRNHIQIMPKYRKEFRGHQAVLHIFEYGWREVYKSGGYSDAQLHSINPNPSEDDWLNHEYYNCVKILPWGERLRYGMFFDNIQEYKDQLKKDKLRLLMQHAYVLEVPTLPGEVDGLYSNFSFDMKAVKRRLGRMVGKNNLKIVKHKGGMFEWLDKKEEDKNV